MFLFSEIYIAEIFTDAEQENQENNDPKAPTDVSTFNNNQFGVPDTPTFSNQFGVPNTPFYNQVCILKLYMYVSLCITNLVFIHVILFQGILSWPFGHPHSYVSYGQMPFSNQVYVYLKYYYSHTF